MATSSETHPPLGARDGGVPLPLDLQHSREVLEQIDLAHRALAAPGVTPATKERLAATIEMLSARLPLVGAAPAALELSGPAWIERFPGSIDPARCIEPFATNLKSFLAALQAAKAKVTIASTFRPPQRAYLMHWCWKIAKSLALPQDAPPMAGVPIDWVHRDGAGQPDVPKSRSAALQMVGGYGLTVQPALQSRHTEGRAVDMSVTWTGTLTIATKGGGSKAISSAPRTGLNKDLRVVGAGYGVIKAVFDDDPHWSDDGH